jgi:hypothetical protein
MGFFSEKADLTGIHGNGVSKVDVKGANGLLTVGELIEALKNVPPETEIDIEGCDCIGQAVQVEFDGYGNVMIGRYL